MKGPFKVQCWLKKLYRRGPRFQQFSRSLERTRHFTSSQMELHQSHLLQKMIRHCYQNVPYYRDLFRELKLKPDAIQYPEDLKKLPLLDKKTVQANFDKMLS